jgi:hypothetical protein
MRNIYSIYFNHVEDEVRALQAERGFSSTWAAGEPVFMLGQLLRSRKERRQEVEITDARAFANAAEEAELVLVEDENHRKLISPKALLTEDHFWTIDCALFRSMERLLREVPESVSVRALTKTLSQSIALPNGVLLSHWDLHDSVSALIFARREVGEICIDERQRRTDLKWIAQADNPRWIRPGWDWPPASDNAARILNRRQYLSYPAPNISKFRILRPQAQVTLKGVRDEMIISAFGLEFLLPSPLQEFFSKEPQLLSVEEIDLRWVLLSIVDRYTIWIRSPAHADGIFEQLGKEEGLWDNVANYCGEAAVAEITAFRVAARESSWKRFGAALWIRDKDE